MKVLLLANNDNVGVSVEDVLLRSNDKIVGLVVHPEKAAEFGGGSTPVFDGVKLRDSETLSEIKALGADIAVSVYFGYILKKEFLDLFLKGVVNLHPGYLPYNRGAHPNVWSIIDGTPAGATLHYVDEGIDTGDIIAQRKVVVEPTDTGKSLYGKLEQACCRLFKDAWPSVLDETATRTPQPEGGTSHLVSDLAKTDEVELDSCYGVRVLLNRIRARTFPPHEGVFFRDENDRKIFVRVSLEGEATE